MPSAPNKITQLIEAAKVRNVELSQDDVETLRRASSDSYLAEWLNVFEPEEALNAQDQPTWPHLQTTQAASTSIVGQMTDNNLRDAVTILEASTHRLNAQTDTIHAQQAILSQHSRLRQQRRIQTTSHAQALQRKTTTEAQHISLANEIKLNDLKAKLQGRLGQVEKQLRLLPAAMKERLNSDDRLLASLESKSNGVQAVTHTFDLVTQRERVELLLKALQTAKADEVKGRLDRMYLETLHATFHAQSAEVASSGPHDLNPHQHEARGAGISGDGQPTPDSVTITDLKAEIESLYEEIDDVAAMVVEHSHGTSLRAHLDYIEVTQRQNENQVLNETLERATTMTKTLEMMKTGIEEKVSEREVLISMLAHLNGIEREMNARTAAMRAATGLGSGVGQDRKAQNALTEMLESLSLSSPSDSSGIQEYAGEIGTETTGKTRMGTMHQSLVDKMQEAAERRRQAVDLLRGLVTSANDSEEKAQELDDRIAEVKAHLEQQM